MTTHHNFGVAAGAAHAPAPGRGLLAPDIERIDLADGGFMLRSRTPTRPHTRRIGDWLEHWSRATPDTIFLAERTNDGQQWRKLSYAQVRQQIGSIAQALLDLGLDEHHPVVIVSDNSIDAALLKLAAMHIGVPVAIVSSAYTTATRDHAKLYGLLGLLAPGLIYASDGAVYGAAVQQAGIACPLVFSERAAGEGIAFEMLCRVRETPAVQRAFAQVGPDTHAKYLLTSGSTGSPKAVINTHDMLCANQEAIAQVWPFLEQKPPVLLDWLPWSHTFGANHNFNLVLRNGGTLYIDDGRPTPALLHKSVRNLREVSPTLYMNVPKGYDALLPLLEQDDELAAGLFRQLDGMFFAGAALPRPTGERLAALAARHRDGPMFFTSAWGATETSPLVTSVHFPTSLSGNIGVPVPGVELKFVPNGSKLEMRVRGRNVFPQYRHAAEATTKAFDADGFYLTGDAGKLADPSDPNAGVLFDGRVAEDFKLTSGTWVSVGTLRVAAVGALAPLAQDVVVAGHGREEVGLMIFPSPALRALASETAVRDAVGAALTSFNAGKASAGRVARAVILSSPPDIGLGESTDKGYTNQRAVLERRADEVERLYSDDPSVIFPV